MIETGVVIAKDGSVIHWHLPVGRSSVYLPDDPSLWQILFENRKNLAGFAHTHPGAGVPSPSMEDLTSFVAIEAGLGCQLEWWISSADRLISVTMTGKISDTVRAYDYSTYEIVQAPSWLDELRWHSHITQS